MRSLRLVAVLSSFAIAVSLGSTSPAAASATGATCAWSLAPSTPLNTVYALAAPSNSEVWVVGSDSHGQPSVSRFDGTTWTDTSLSDPGSQLGALEAVSSVAPNDVWAGGWGYFSGIPDRAVAAHWDGGTWTFFPLPVPSGSSSRVTSIDAHHANDVWAAGYLDARRHASGTGLVWHWNGVRWSKVSNPPMSSEGSGVAATSPESAWVGADVAIDHLDGGGWTTTHLPNFDLPSALSAVSSTDVWAVGHSSNSNMTAHYDGLDWNDVFIPNRGTAPIQGLESVVARTANSVWAGGYRGYDYRPSIWHWTGTAWHISKTPGDGKSHQDIVSLDDVPGVRTVWALGAGEMVERFC